MCLPSSATLKTLTIYVVTHSTGLPQNKGCLLSFHLCIRYTDSRSVKKVYKLPTLSQVPQYVTTRHPHHTVVDEPGTAFMPHSQCWRQTILERVSITMHSKGPNLNACHGVWSLWPRKVVQLITNRKQGRTGLAQR